MIVRKVMQKSSGHISWLVENLLVQWMESFITLRSVEQICVFNGNEMRIAAHR